MASPLPLNPEAHRPQDVLCPQCCLKRWLKSEFPKNVWWRVFPHPAYLQTPPVAPQSCLSHGDLEWIGGWGGREDMLCECQHQVSHKVSLGADDLHTTPDIRGSGGKACLCGHHQE